MKRVRKGSEHISSDRFSRKLNGAGTPTTFREATSARMLRIPGVWYTAGGEARLDRCRIAIPRRRRNEMGVVLRDAIWVIHATAGELSHPIADWMPAMDCIPSLASSAPSCSTTPAISKSELVTVPPGLASDTRASVMSFGHCTRHTIGDKEDSAPNHTPPAPQPLASQ